MTLPIQNASASQVFTDVPPSHSNFKDILYLLEHGVIVAKAVKLDGAPRTTKFKDVPKSNPNSGYIQSAVEAGIINGYNDDTFKWANKVT
ncbi:S-layer homology domain-containing protein [Lysinibacillus sp. NPDC096418]|uniref:S-layer homology domain-containing protein n=1 Tax=Lysinibacillus sp. NPDC096418 TaxID=3364138 RepID=UPI00381B1EAB